MSHTPGEPDPPPKYRANRGYHCLDCNYNLRGLQNHTCPECGRPFDPEDAKTYNAFPTSTVGTIGKLLMLGNGPLDLIECIPYSQRQEVVEQIKKSKRVKRTTYLCALPLLTLAIAYAAALLILPHSTAIWVLFASMLLTMLLINVAGYFIRRAYADELRRMKILFTQCPKCGYNLAAITAARCPKCDTLLVNEN